MRRLSLSAPSIRYNLLAGYSQGGMPVAVSISPVLQEIVEAADAGEAPLDENELAGRLNASITADIRSLPLDQRRGALSLIGGLQFQRKRLHGNPTWDMYWQPLISFTTEGGVVHHSPDVALIDEEIRADWNTRSEGFQHPVLRARFADLAWTIGRYQRGRPAVAAAWRAIDSYLNAVERHLVADDLHAWFMLARAIELALSVSDSARAARAKRVLFDFQAHCRDQNSTYVFWPFDDIVWEHADALALTDQEKAAIIGELERILALRANQSDPQMFDPSNAQDAADRLGRWRTRAGESTEAARAASTAGQALEHAATLASSLTATAWLSQLLRRYHDAGDDAGAARVERQIRARAHEIPDDMRTVSVPFNIPPEDLQALTERVAGEDLSQAFKNFAAVGIVGEQSIRAQLETMIQNAPVFSAIPMSIVGSDGFPAAEIGPVEGDIEGRMFEQGARHIGIYAPFLNIMLARIREKHRLDLERFMAWLADSPVFVSGQMPLVRDGLAAWFACDYVKSIHVLVPQVEAATRELLSKLNGSVRRPDPNNGGFRVLGFGEVLSDEIFRSKVPSDLRFHLRVLYQDSRGINLRNILAHGLAATDLFGRGVGNWVIHTIVLLGNLRITREPPPAQP
jgi:hypothetical protein